MKSTHTASGLITCIGGQPAMVKGSVIAPSDNGKYADSTSLPTGPGISRINQVRQSARTTAKLSQIAPAEPTAEQLKLESKRILGQHEGALTFGQAFGVLGLPMLFILLVCLTWTSWLIFLALTPNKAANLLMDTGSYDNGQFWLFNDANPQMIIAGAVGLVVVDICYLLVTLRMLFWRDKLFDSHIYHSQSAICMNGSYSWSSKSQAYKRLRRVWKDLTAFEGQNRKKWVGIHFHH
ncbi:unnamed protein product [Phytophthora lilii]|uniref:Unnamed protein product n=1 Tax=Phytophthora lilii TaxID=2077276 RepID=A0A9W6THJ5_9STRA|nr:unnamed protein product [Phytophthora lilii]